mgnify:CR=1 FL=1
MFDLVKVLRHSLCELIQPSMQFLINVHLYVSMARAFPAIQFHVLADKG